MNTTPSEQKTVLRFLSDPYQDVAYLMGAKLLGLNLRAKEHSYLLIVKVEDKVKGKLVCFIETETAIGCFAYFVEYLTKERVPLRWREDKY